MNSIAPRSGGRRRRGTHLTGTLVIVGVVLAWETASRVGILSPHAVPPPGAVLMALLQMLIASSFWTAVGQTLVSWLVGIAMAIALAVPFGVAIGRSKFLTASTRLLTDLLRTVPTVAIIPVLVLIFGSTIEMKLVVIVFGAFWPILIQTIHGVADVDRVIVDTSRAYRMRAVDKFAFVFVPSTLPYVMTGIRFAAVVALLLSLTAELIGSAAGLGLELSLAQFGGASDRMYALIIVTGLLGMAINGLLLFFNRRVLAWHPSVRGQSS